MTTINPVILDITLSAAAVVVVVVIVIEVPLPIPMPLPPPLIHLINGDSLGLGQEEDSENTHDDDEGREEEGAGFHLAKHGEEDLGDQEGAQHIHGNSKEEAGRSSLNWVDFTWD